jgi:hypothetical protein
MTGVLIIFDFFSANLGKIELNILINEIFLQTQDMEDNDQGQHANALGQGPPEDLVEEVMEIAMRIKEDSQIECSFELWLIFIRFAFEILFTSPRTIFARIFGFLLFIVFSFIFPLSAVFILVHNMFADIKAFLFDLADLN